VDEPDLGRQKKKKKKNTTFFFGANIRKIFKKNIQKIFEKYSKNIRSVSSHRRTRGIGGVACVTGAVPGCMLHSGSPLAPFSDPQTVNIRKIFEKYSIFKK